MRLEQIRSSFLPLIPVGIAATVGLAICFAYAPAMRFVSGYFFVVVGLFVAGVLGSGNWLGIPWVRKAMLIGLTVTAIIPNLRAPR